MYRRLSTLATLCLITAVALAPGSAFAQDDTMDRDLLDLFLPSDSTELQLQGATSIALDSDSSHSGAAFVNYGWFLTERQQVGGSAVITIFEDVDGDVDLSGYGGPFYRYNILTGKVAPYVGASLGASFGDFGGGGASVGDFLLELEAGSRWFLRRDVSFNVAAGMLYDIDASELSDFVNVRFGFSYFWQ